MSDRSVARGLRVAAVVGGAMAVIGSAMFVASGSAGTWWSGFFAFVAMVSVFFAVLAWLVVPRQPGNAVVWIMATFALFGGLHLLISAVVALMVDDPGLALGSSVITADLPQSAAWVLVFAEPPAIVAIFAWLTFGLLLFPDGKLPSPRWRWVGAFAIVGTALVTVGSALDHRPGSTIPAVDQEGLLTGVGFSIATIAVVASLVALVVRFRRSTGETREQFKWVVWGAAIFVPAEVLTSVFGGSQYEDLFLAPLMLAAALFIGAFGIAVGKYRLYDIDVVISKTVTYVSLAVVIAVLYGVPILLITLLFGDTDLRESDLGLALLFGATALVAFAFEPVRLRLQRWANRMVYGHRAAPYEVLAGLTSTLSEASAGESLSELAQLLQEGTGAEGAAVWLRVGDRLRAEAASPFDAIPSPSEISTEEDLPRSELELSVPVRHGGELLGALGVTKPRAHPVTSADEDLLVDIAAGAGLLLRNLRLNAELAERAVQLQASRRRLIAAQDASRHRLERDLHDGAQQQVVALKVKLGLATTIAEREGADDLATKVASLAEGTQKAVDAMRNVAHGIYPPLLEAQGLGPAFTAARRTSDLPLRIESETVSRYSKEVEETMYFCVLAAVGRAKMAGATYARVNVQEDGTSLTGRVTYDAPDRGDLTMVTDRVDAFGGTVAVANSAGETTMRLAIPIASEVLEPA